MNTIPVATDFAAASRNPSAYVCQQLFVYSSLRKGFHDARYLYLTKFFDFVCKAEVKGILSISELGPVASQLSENHFIKGELYHLKKEDDFSWVFGQLDEYEGLTPPPDEQSLFRREVTTVYKEDGSVTDAWIFWYNADVSDKPVIASGDILEYM